MKLWTRGYQAVFGCAWIFAATRLEVRVTRLPEAAAIELIPNVGTATARRHRYEALTRFADGTPPDRLIADAHRVGLGVELEVAYLAAACAASAALPDDCGSASMAHRGVILGSADLAALLHGRARPIVIEPTER